MSYSPPNRGVRAPSRISGTHDINKSCFRGSPHFICCRCCRKRSAWRLWRPRQKNMLKRCWDCSNAEFTSWNTHARTHTHMTLQVTLQMSSILSLHKIPACSMLIYVCLTWTWIVKTKLLYYAKGIDINTCLAPLKSRRVQFIQLLFKSASLADLGIQSN